MCVCVCVCVCVCGVCVCVCVRVSVSVCAHFGLWEHQHMFAICTAGARRIQFSQKKKAQGLEKVAKHLSTNSHKHTKVFF